MRFAIPILVSLLVGLPSVAVTQGITEIDLVAGTIDGTHFTDLSLDDITDQLGRPVAVVDGRVIYTRGDGTLIVPMIEYKNPRVPILIEKTAFYGPRLSYHQLGLDFSFEPASHDPLQRCNEVIVHLSREWDESASESFEPFAGKVTQGITADWKAARLFEAFATLEPEDMRSPERLEVYSSASSHPLLADLLGSEPRPEVLLELESHDVRILYEKNTGFVESFRLIPREGVFPKDGASNDSAGGATPD